jgi:N-acetylglucosaminyl-diphospho-decaprenol L-rhamnosyltransferase
MNAVVGIVIVSHQSKSSLAQSLQALPQSLPGHTWRAVVVDNASTDGSAEIARGLGATVIRNSRNLGYAQAANTGWAELSDADYVIFLNPDTIPEPGSLSRLVEILERDPSIAVASALLKKEDGSLKRTVRSDFPTFRREAARLFGVGRFGFNRHPAQRPVSGRILDVAWVGGACLAMHRRTIQALGGYDERFFLYVEDADLCLRAHEAGRVVVVGDAAVVHLGGISASHNGSVVTSARRARAIVAFIAKHNGRLLAFLYVALATLRYLPNSVWEAVSRRPPRHAARIRAMIAEVKKRRATEK